jgi:ATP-dependent protease HslVU (ClpYQ) peptidase subunit
MSLIVAIKKDGVVYLGADTRATRGERVCSNLAQTDLKIQRLGSCYVGTAGNVANIQLMTSRPEWFELKGKPLTKRFLVQNVLPKYYDQVKEMDKLEIGEQNSNSPKCGCSFLVTDGQRLFEIDDDFEVFELSKYGQIGCTSRIALTFLFNAPQEYVPNEMILKILRTSAHRNDGVGAPYILVNTKDNQFEVVEE